MDHEVLGIFMLSRQSKSQGMSLNFKDFVIEFLTSLDNYVAQ